MPKSFKKKKKINWERVFNIFCVGLIIFYIIWGGTYVWEVYEDESIEYFTPNPKVIAQRYNNIKNWKGNNSNIENVESVDLLNIKTVDLSNVDKFEEGWDEFTDKDYMRNVIYEMTSEFNTIDPLIVSEEIVLRIAECESNFDRYAKNPNSTAKGLFQFTDGTWEYIKAQGHQFDYRENIKQFLIWFPVHPEWWKECNK